MRQPTTSGSDSSRFRPALFWLSLAASFGLIAAGVGFIVDHARAAKGFGVPLDGGPDNAYITVAAVRDLAVGALALVFTLLRDRRAVGLCVLFGAIIPIGDGCVVLSHSPTPLPFLFVHWGAAVACVVFAFFLLRRS